MPASMSSCARLLHVARSLATRRSISSGDNSICAALSATESDASLSATAAAALAGLAMRRPPIVSRLPASTSVRALFRTTAHSLSFRGALVSTPLVEIVVATAAKMTSDEGSTNASMRSWTVATGLSAGGRTARLGVDDGAAAGFDTGCCASTRLVKKTGKHISSTRCTSCIRPTPSRRVRGAAFFSQPPRVSSLGLASVLDFDQRHAVDAAAREREVAVACHRHVAHDAAARGDGPGLEFFRLRIEAHDRVRLHAGFAVPDDVVYRGNPIG